MESSAWHGSSTANGFFLCSGFPFECNSWDWIYSSLAKSLHSANWWLEKGVVEFASPPHHIKHLTNRIWFLLKPYFLLHLISFSYAIVPYFQFNYIWLLGRGGGVDLCIYHLKLRWQSLVVFTNIYQINMLKQISDDLCFTKIRKTIRIKLLHPTLITCVNWQKYACAGQLSISGGFLVLTL